MTPKAIHNLVIELPGCSPRHYQLVAASIRLGRVEGNAIVVEDETISAKHCELKRTATSYEILDLDSTNGTRVNGERLAGDARELRDGDSILIGLSAKARFVRVIEIKDRVEARPTQAGTVTRKLERPEINPVAAAVAKAARANAKPA